MKFCTHCGTQLHDEAVVCLKCGAPAEKVKTNLPTALETKYCTHCGAQVLKDAVICPKCGCSVKSRNTSNVGTGLQTAAKVLMILSCVGAAIAAVVMLILGIYASYAEGLLIGTNYLDDPDLIELVELVDLMALFYVMAAFCGIALLWAVPMTVHYFKATKNKQPVGVAFKICTLLFVNTISGILMLCDVSDNQ